MKAIINISISILLLCGLCSLTNCKTCSNKSAGTCLTETPQPAETAQIDTVKLSMNIDSVEVVANFFGSGNRNSFILYISDSEIRKVDYHYKKNVTVIESINLKNELTTYINKFFIDKTEKTIESKTKRGWIESTDYPIIRVTGFLEKREIFNTRIMIGDEVYDIVYNPEFLKFFKLLDSMAMTR